MRDLRAPSSVRIPVTKVDRRSQSRQGPREYTRIYRNIQAECLKECIREKKKKEVGDSCGDDLFPAIRYDLYLAGCRTPALAAVLLHREILVAQYLDVATRSPFAFCLALQGYSAGASRFTEESTNLCVRSLPMSRLSSGNSYLTSSVMVAVNAPLV